MKFRLCVIGIILICFLFPYTRLFIKRWCLSFKIKSICRKKGFSLYRTHSFWFLGSRNGKACDFLIETKNELFGIKLFGMPRRRRVLVFTENKEFIIRMFVMLVEGRFFFWLRETFDSNVRPVPEYDFSCANYKGSEDNKIRKILLINPVPMEMLLQAECGAERILNPGDELYGMEIANLSWLLKELQ